MRTILTLIVTITLFVTCDNSSKKVTDCPLGQPTPIFSDSLSQVTDHQFELNGQSSLETISFKNGVVLELNQSGCEEISQEFQFKLKEIPNKANTLSWVQAGVEQFRFMSGLGEKYAPFFQWATSIDDQKEKFALNTPMELAPGFFVTFNKVPGNDYNILIVRLHTES